jgi:FtsP/CotA-like multicopper oxidase with cupredoxin domain
MRIKALTAALFLGLGLTACADPDAPPPVDDPDVAVEPAALQTPAWFVVDHDAQTVEMDIIAGTTSANNYWNFHGLYGGAGEIVVPEGYEITLTLINQDPNMGHSAGVGEVMATWPNNFTEVVPVFEGAVTSNPTSMTESTLPGEEESITFVADRSGDFALICYVIGHAASGMWMPFTVSAEGEAGVRLN